MPPRFLADGDHVVVRWPARGTHLGDGLGMPPTNRSVDFRGMTWLTFKNGVIVEGRIPGTWAGSWSRSTEVTLVNHDDLPPTAHDTKGPAVTPDLITAQADRVRRGSTDG